MTKKNPPHKKKSILLNLDQETDDFLTKYSKIVGISKSQLLRNSINNFSNLNLDNPNYPNPKSIFSQSTMHYLFDRCTEEEIRDLAELSFKISIQELKRSELWHNGPIHIEPEVLISKLVKLVFSRRGQGWFDECSYRIRGSIIHLWGSHNMGPNFHIFVKCHLKYYLELCNYEILEDKQDLDEIREMAQDFDMLDVKRKYYRFSVRMGPKS